MHHRGLIWFYINWLEGDDHPENKSEALRSYNNKQHRLEYSLRGVLCCLYKGYYQNSASDWQENGFLSVKSKKKKIFKTRTPEVVSDWVINTIGLKQGCKLLNLIDFASTHKMSHKKFANILKIIYL